MWERGECSLVHILGAIINDPSDGAAIVNGQALTAALSKANNDATDREVLITGGGYYGIVRAGELTS